mgnify:CR=1 FL=1
MFKKILTAALVTSMLILPVSSVGPAGSVEAPASVQTQSYLPGDVPAETDAAESMSPALHAMVNHDVKRFDFNDAALTWEGLYNMLSLYGQMDSRSITEQGELFLPEETVMDYAAVLGVDLDELGAPPASIRDRLNYDNVSRSYVVVCGEDNLAQIQVESLTASSDGYVLTGALVYEVENEVLVRFQASLQPRDNMFGFVVSALGEV